ncbi:hypothetical protein HPB49_013776 [Dermacentor silvarum]|uniref:Uncharacterized protein n=1 Tax=Dermacentor silvarum TaxID=543639 RepID=A0ACB8DPJ4_DERSI|nr:hypothetical protein HPB49_013776 [Dermacentor silvarum]
MPKCRSFKFSECAGSGSADIVKEEPPDSSADESEATAMEAAVQVTGGNKTVNAFGKLTFSSNASSAMMSSTRTSFCSSTRLCTGRSGHSGVASAVPISPRRAEMAEHESTHPDKHQLRCLICSKVFGHRTLLRETYAEAHHPADVKLPPVSHGVRSPVCILCLVCRML